MSLMIVAATPVIGLGVLLIVGGVGGISAEGRRDEIRRARMALAVALAYLVGPTVAIFGLWLATQ